MTCKDVPQGRPVRRPRRVVVTDLSAIARSVGQRIRAARVAAGLNQRQLAAERYTGAYISALESGKAKPSVAALTFIASQLGLDPAELLSSLPAAPTVVAMPRRVWFAEDRLYFELDSGVHIGVPTAWIPALERASLRDARELEVDANARTVRWSKLKAEVKLTHLLRRAGLSPE